MPEAQTPASATLGCFADAPKKHLKGMHIRIGEWQHGCQRRRPLEHRSTTHIPRGVGSTSICVSVEM
eukprot:1159308-Pelagomonas_calceolata.AAC.4